MCKPMSWIEWDGTIYFLTAKDLLTKEGRALRSYLESAFAEDVVGHGAIEYFYKGLEGKGTHKEVGDFSDPALFPAEIVNALKSGAFKGMFPPPRDIMSAPLYAEYEKQRTSLYAEYWDSIKKAKNRSKAWG